MFILAVFRKNNPCGVKMETKIYRTNLAFCSSVCQKNTVFFHFLINIWPISGGSKVESKDFLKGKATGDWKEDLS